MADIHNFLLVFDHANDRLIKQLNFFDDHERATEEYARQEHAYSGNPNIDVVLVGSDSIETVMVTHANYFEGRSKRLIDDAFNLFAS